MSFTQPSGIPTLNKLSNTNIQNIDNQLNLVDDTCNCNFCQAILFISFNGKQIPVSQYDFDNTLFGGYTGMFPLYKMIPYSRYITFTKK